MKPEKLWRLFQAKKDVGQTPAQPSAQVAQTPPQPAATYNTARTYIPSSSFQGFVQQLNSFYTPETSFSGKDFAIGTAKGARSFRIDPLGRLTGINFRSVWLPGENRAECLADEKHAEGKFPTCTCGFYGYYDGSNDYYHEGYVSAVVEGYGEAVMGDRGFRVMKARILALCINDSVQAKNAHLVRRNYPQIPIFDTFRGMLAEFPTDYELDSPSPEDGDFWTRSA